MLQFTQSYKEGKSADNLYHLSLKGQKMNCLKCSFISVLFLICVTTEVSSACTWQLRDSCYHYVKQKEQFWAAEAHCNTNYNGHLLAINTQEENDFILTRLMETHNLESTT